MKINKIKNIFFVSFVIIILQSCLSKGKHSADTYKPRYSDNGGIIPTLFFNQEKVNNEKKYIAALEAIKKARIDAGLYNKGINSSSTDSTEILINSVGNSISKQIDSLELVLNSINPYINPDNTVLTVLSELNNLYYNRINPFNKLRNKSVNTLKSDFLFQTGKSDISTSGTIEIQNLIKNIENEILEWKSYKDENDKKIFSNDIFKITRQINGYADKQGDETSNKKLSFERAKEVRDVFVKELKKLTTKYGIRYSVNFEGKGEELPPNVLDNSKLDDPKRRVCVIYIVVGPLSLLKKN
jgi:outer membrane protein OmpA-like peptidoglycan-associated protein